jgi:hypothetical protein
MVLKKPQPKARERRKHFDYLVGKYLPNHTGWKWSEARGFSVDVSI